MNVIDCFTREIVPMDKDSKYIALSYVWGKEQPAMTALDAAVQHTLNYVPNPAPATVEDSMTAVKGLGRHISESIDTASPTLQASTA